MRSLPDTAVVKWLDRQPAESVWITSVTLFEARFGLALLPPGRRRQRLELEFDRLLRENLENRVLDFDSAAAAETASLAAARRKSGRPWTCVTAKLPALRWRATPAFPRQHPYDILRERKPVSPAIAVRLGKLLAVALVGSHAGRLRYMECRAQRGCQRMAPHFER